MAIPVTASRAFTFVEDADWLRDPDGSVTATAAVSENNSSIQMGVNPSLWAKPFGGTHSGANINQFIAVPAQVPPRVWQNMAWYDKARNLRTTFNFRFQVSFAEDDEKKPEQRLIIGIARTYDNTILDLDGLEPNSNRYLMDDAVLSDPSELDKHPSIFKYKVITYQRGAKRPVRNYSFNASWNPSWSAKSAMRHATNGADAKDDTDVDQPILASTYSVHRLPKPTTMPNTALGPGAAVDTNNSGMIDLWRCTSKDNHFDDNLAANRQGFFPPRRPEYRVFIARHVNRAKANVDSAGWEDDVANQGAFYPSPDSIQIKLLATYEVRFSRDADTDKDSLTFLKRPGDYDPFLHTFNHR